MADTQIFALFGTDEARVREEAAALIKKMVPAGSEDFGLEIIEGQADNSDHARQICARVIEAIQTLPFMGGEKVVWLKGANFVADNQLGTSKDTIEGHENLISVLEAGVPPDVRVVISGSAVHKGRRFYKCLAKFSKPKHFDKVDAKKQGWQQEVMGMIRGRGKERGLSFANNALELFVNTVGEDTGQLESELEKLDLFLGDARREVTVEDIRQISSSTRAGVIFEVGNAIAKRDLATALMRVEYLLGRGENGIGIIRATVITEIRRQLNASLIRAAMGTVPTTYPNFKSALERLPKSVTANIPLTKDGKGFNAYPLFMTMGGGSKFTVPELTRALEICLETDVKMVTTSLDHRLLLTQLLTRIIGSPQSVAA